jgi:hypothetical protein
MNFNSLLTYTPHPHPYIQKMKNKPNHYNEKEGILLCTIVFVIYLVYYWVNN